jgi:glycosyltransferase involved in cell wall biosynthesis
VDVTVVLPCFNEVGHVAAEIERITDALDGSGYTYDIDVYDDCSTDGTRELLQDIADSGKYERLRYFPRRRNGGSGTIRRTGSQAARIPELVDFLVKDESYDQVVGARRTEEGTFKLVRVPAKWAIRRIASYLTNTKIPDLNSGLRAFRREASLPYLNLLPPGFSCVTTLTVAFLSNNLDVAYVPIDYAKRSGKSKFHPFKDAYRYILQVLRMVMYFNPLKVLMPLALWVIALGSGKLVYDLVVHHYRITGSTVLVLVTGFQIAALALIGDLIVRSRQQR